MRRTSGIAPWSFLVSTGCRISEALQLDRTDWAGERVVVRGKGDVERAAVITDHARAEVARYLAARGDAAPMRSDSSVCWRLVRGAATGA